MTDLPVYVTSTALVTLASTLSAGIPLVALCVFALIVLAVAYAHVHKNGLPTPGDLTSTQNGSDVGVAARSILVASWKEIEPEVHNIPGLKATVYRVERALGKPVLTEQAAAAVLQDMNECRLRVAAHQDLHTRQPTVDRAATLERLAYAQHATDTLGPKWNAQAAQDAIDDTRQLLNNHDGTQQSSRLISEALDDAERLAFEQPALDTLIRERSVAITARAEALLVTIRATGASAAEAILHLNEAKGFADASLAPISSPSQQNWYAAETTLALADNALSKAIDHQKALQK